MQRIVYSVPGRAVHRFMAGFTKQTLDGHIETIILSELTGGAEYGYALVRRINATHRGLLSLGEGTIYPVLYRMEEKGLVRPDVRMMPNGRRRKYYSLTRRGKAALSRNLEQWVNLSRVLRRIQENLVAPEPPLGQPNQVSVNGDPRCLSEALSS